MAEAVNQETLQNITKRWAIGLTGGIATGKSTIARHLRALGELVIDADQLAREVVAPGTEGLQAILEHFGPRVLQVDGQLDRALMRQIIFTDEAQRRALEAITHPRIQAATTRALQRFGFMNPGQERIWFYEASLLYERGRAQDFRAIWVAYCPEEVQIERLQRRDRCSEQEARRILAAQMPARMKADRADRVIATDCSEDELAQRVAAARAELYRGIS